MMDPKTRATKGSFYKSLEVRVPAAWHPRGFCAGLDARGVAALGSADAESCRQARLARQGYGPASELRRLALCGGRGLTMALLRVFYEKIVAGSHFVVSPRPK